MKKTQKTPRELLRKSHAHKSKRDYNRKAVSSDKWSDHFSGMPNLDIKDLTDKAGSHE